MRVRSVLLCITGILACGVVHAKPSMQMMVANGHVIELSDLRRVTANSDGRVESVFISPDGKYLAFLSRDSGYEGRIGVAAYSAGRSVLIASGVPVVKGEPRLASGRDYWCAAGSTCVAWSPDSRSVACSVTHSMVQREVDAGNAPPQAGNGSMQTEEGILIVSASGIRRAFAAIPDGASIDSRRSGRPTAQRLP